MKKRVVPRVLSLMLALTLFFSQSTIEGYATSDDAASLVSSVGTVDEVPNKASSELSTYSSAEDASTEISTPEANDENDAASALAGSNDSFVDDADAEVSDEEEKSDLESSVEASSLGSSEVAADEASSASSLASDAAPEEEGELITEVVVGPAYEGIYTEDDIQRSIEEQFTEEELLPEELEDGVSYILDTASNVSGCRSAMAKRSGSFSYTSSSFDAGSVVEKALADTDETAPKYGDYLKGSLIGYSSSGKGSGGTYSITISFIYSSTAAQEKAVDEKVTSIINKLDLNSSSLIETCISL